MRRAAVLCGIDSYWYDGWSKLNHGVDDCERMRNALLEPRYGFEARDIVVLTDSRDDPSTMPIKNNLLYGKFLDQFAGDEIDLLVFYFSGHGFAAGADFGKDNSLTESYLVPIDGVCRRTDTGWQPIPDTCVPLESIANRVAKLGVKKTVFIFDICRGSASGVLPRTFRDQAFANEDCIVITGCDIGERSHEDSRSLKAGVFTFFLTEALLGQGDFVTSPSGGVSVFDIHQYAQRKVEKWAEDNDRVQNPQIWANNGTYLTLEKEVIPPHLETPESRTHQVVNALKQVARERKAGVEDDYCIRIIARLSSLAISDDEPVHAERQNYHSFLCQERDRLYDLISDSGVELKAILTWELNQQLSLPETPAELVKCRLAQLRLYAQSLSNHPDILERVKIVHLPMLAERNLLFLGNDILFEGRKLQIDRLYVGGGFDATRVVNDPESIEREISIFDLLFDNAIEYIGAEHSVRRGAPENEDLMKVLLADIDKDLAEVSRMHP